MDKKKSKRITTIIKEISNADIAAFIINEVEDTLQYLNIYKLNNIVKNIEMMKKFLNDLDNRNTEMYRDNDNVSKLSEKNTTSPDKYVSNKGWSTLSKKEKKSFINIANEDKAQKSTIIKGLFLLSICDFAQGNLCRLENKYHYNIDTPYITIKKKQHK